MQGMTAVRHVAQDDLSLLARLLRPRDAHLSQGDPGIASNSREPQRLDPLGQYLLDKMSVPKLITVAAGYVAGSVNQLAIRLSAVFSTHAPS